MVPENASTELAALFASRAQLLLAQPSLEQTVQEVVDLAAATVDGADHAGVTLVRDKGQVQSQAVTSPLVTKLDALQAELGEGPCLEAMTEEPFLILEDTARDRRWPRFSERAAELGIRSMLACRLSAERGTLGCLNLHSLAPGAFDTAAQEVATVYAVHASIALSQARLVETLTAARDSRQVIGEATGILMERYRVTSPQAFDMLVRASQTMNVKLRHVAARVVETGTSPADLDGDELTPGT